MDTAVSATFSSIYNEILLKKCGGASCHSAANGGTLFIDPSKSASALRAALVNGAATGVACGGSGLSLVVPGDASASLLYTKLTESPPCGMRMPAVTDDELARIERWIVAGAADN